MKRTDIKKTVIILFIVSLCLLFQKNEIKAADNNGSKVDTTHKKNNSVIPYRVFIGTNPEQFIVKQPNLSVKIKFAPKWAIEFYAAKIFRFESKGNSAYQSGLAFVSDLLDGERFKVGLEKWFIRESSNFFLKINADYSKKSTFNTEVTFGGSKEDNQGSVIFNQKRVNEKISVEFGNEIKISKNFLLNLYAGLGVKSMTLETKKISSQNIKGGHLNGDKFFYDGSNYILPTINIGCSIGFCF